MPLGPGRLPAPPGETGKAQVVLDVPETGFDGPGTLLVKVAPFGGPQGVLHGGAGLRPSGDGPGGGPVCPGEAGFFGGYEAGGPRGGQVGLRAVTGVSQHHPDGPDKRLRLGQPATMGRNNAMSLGSQDTSAATMIPM